MATRLQTRGACLVLRAVATKYGMCGTDTAPSYAMSGAHIAYGVYCTGVGCAIFLPLSAYGCHYDACGTDVAYVFARLRRGHGGWYVPSPITA
eukprot:3011965-Rhodomonas_salina.9